MAKKPKTTGLMQNLGEKARKIFDRHKDDATDYGQQDLPAGINNGVAQLVDCKFDIFKTGTKFEGEYFFFAAGVVVEPVEFEGTRIEGQRTQIIEPLCVTPGRKREDVESHLAWVMNELRKLGVDTSSLDYNDLEAVVKALETEQPFFRFRTWIGTKQETGPYAGLEPRVQHQWLGVCDTPDVGNVEDIDEDGTDGTNGTNVEDVEEDSSDVTNLGIAADDNDDDAQVQLSTMAQNAGIDPEKFETWTELAEAIVAESEGGNDQYEPSVGDVFKFKPPRAKNLIELTITAVYPGKETVNGKGSNGKPYKSIPWSKLE